MLSKHSLSLAWSTIKGRRSGFVAAFLAVVFGSTVITACGILLQTGISSGVPTERYQAAAVVVGADQTLPISGDINPRFGERVRLPIEWVDDVAAVPGVATAVGDVNVPMDLVASDGRVLPEPDSEPLFGHGWSAAELGPFTLTAGAPPDAAEDVVLEARLADRAGVAVGDPIELIFGSASRSYRVAGVVEPPGEELTRQYALFLTDGHARELSGWPDHVDAVGVLAEPGVSPGELADRIGDAVPEAVTYTGTSRTDVESLVVGERRSFVIEVALSFGATMIVIVVIVVASTLALSVQQRRRELALLRAVGATPKQVLRMVGAETLLVSVAGAVLGAIPGIGLAILLHWTFTAGGALPPGFALVVTPLPVMAAVLLCLVGARVGGWIAARRAAKVSPIEALGDAAVEPRKLGWLRISIGLLLIPLGLATAIVLPVLLPGEAAIDGAASSALLLVIAVILLGPRLLGGAVSVLGPRLNRSGAVSGFLAIANARAKSRRLSAATTPLIIGVTMAVAQIFSATTLGAAAMEQADDGTLADHVVYSRSAGLSPELLEVLSQVDGVETAAPVVRTQAIVTFASGDSEEFRIVAAQGIDPGASGATLDLGVVEGDLGELTGDTVALSRLIAGTIRAELGDTIDLHLGDGTSTQPRVVAIYEKGFGFGDVTVANEVAIRHVTDPLYDWMLVRSSPGFDRDTLRANLDATLAAFPTVAVTDEGSVAAAGGGDGGESVVGLVLNAVLLCYLAIAVVNTLVMATAARVREFAMLRLIGAKTRQVRSMMHREARVIVVAAVLIGTLAALPALIGMSYAVRQTPVPAISPLIYLGIVAVAALIAWPAILLPARFAMRERPVEAIGAAE